MRTNSIGFLQLTLFHSGTTAYVKCKAVASFYRKPENDYTAVYAEGTSDYYMVRETPEEIVMQIEDISPDLR